VNADEQDSDAHLRRLIRQPFQIDNMPPLCIRTTTRRGWSSSICFRTPPSQSQYVIGKYQIEKLIAERRVALSSHFDLRAAHDDLFRAGPIPTSLIIWELTGDESEIRQLAVVRKDAHAEAAEIADGAKERVMRLYLLQRSASRTRTNVWDVRLFG
jgi:hypothetical protein